MNHSRVRFGRIANLSVRAWLERHAIAIRAMPYILISSLDSTVDVADMSWVAARRDADPEWAISLSPLVISGASAVDLLEGNLFTGFDELWIPSEMPVARPPGDASLVAPRELDVEAPPAVVAWLEGSKCRLGVGDGYGMNYAVLDESIGAELGLD